MQFADKTTLGQSAILGLLYVRLPPSTADCSHILSISQGAHINQDQFNWLGTIFYLFFLGFEWPQNLALQYFPVGKWMRCVVRSKLHVIY